MTAEGKQGEDEGPQLCTFRPIAAVLRMEYTTGVLLIASANHVTFVALRQDCWASETPSPTPNLSPRAESAPDTMPDLTNTAIANPDMFEERLKNVPHAPGVYIWKDAFGKILYVGKSKVLRDRMRSYFG